MNTSIESGRRTADHPGVKPDRVARDPLRLPRHLRVVSKTAGTLALTLAGILVLSSQAMTGPATGSPGAMTGPASGSPGAMTGPATGSSGAMRAMTGPAQAATGAMKAQRTGSTKAFTNLAEAGAQVAIGPVVLFFAADWCPTCAKTLRELEEGAARLGDISIRIVDYDRSAALKRSFGVTAQHSFVQIDKEGKKLALWNGGGLEGLLASVRRPGSGTAAPLRSSPSNPALPVPSGTTPGR